MPIYEYRCSACGFEKDALQKMSDPPLTDCPNCGQPALVKLVSAAGFQLKGSGWYVTDFKSSGTKPPAAKGDAAKSESAKGDAPTADAASTASNGTKAAGSSESKSSDKSEASSTSKPAATPGTGD